MVNSVSRLERERNEIVPREVAKVTWAQTLLKEIENRGGLDAPAAFLFEARVAYEIHVVGFRATYEYLPPERLNWFPTTESSKERQSQAQARFFGCP